MLNIWIAPSNDPPVEEVQRYFRMQREKGGRGDFPNLPSDTLARIITYCYGCDAMCWGSNNAYVSDYCDNCKKNPDKKVGF